MQDELEFRRNAESAIAALKQALIRAEDQAEFEAEEQNGVLNVVFDEPPAKFVITPNSPVRQIWVSGSLPTLPRRITLLTLLAMTDSLRQIGFR